MKKAQEDQELAPKQPERERWKTHLLKKGVLRPRLIKLAFQISEVVSHDEAQSGSWPRVQTGLQFGKHSSA